MQIFRFAALVLSAVIVWTLPALAQTAAEADAAFVPADGDRAAMVIYRSGETRAAIESKDGRRPSECEAGQFWIRDQSSLVSCSDGAVYELKPLDRAADFPFVGAMKLEPAKAGPKPGTDDPGPMNPPK